MERNDENKIQIRNSANDFLVFSKENGGDGKIYTQKYYNLQAIIVDELTREPGAEGGGDEK
jgi:hypothetical protein